MQPRKKQTKPKMMTDVIFEHFAFKLQGFISPLEVTCYTSSYKISTYNEKCTLLLL